MIRPIKNVSRMPSALRRRSTDDRQPIGSPAGHRSGRSRFGRLPFALAIALVAAGCMDKAQPPPTPAPAPAPTPVPPPTPPAPAPQTGVPEPEPSRILVQHVLIAFKGAHRAPATVTRSRDDAANLANEILGRVRKGEDIAALSKEYSSDPGGGRYRLVNTGVQAGQGDIPRAQFIKPFVDLAFKLKVGEAGLVEYDPTKDAQGRPNSPFGYHVIKRLE